MIALYPEDMKGREGRREKQEDNRRDTRERGEGKDKKRQTARREKKNWGIKVTLYPNKRATYLDS